VQISGISGRCERPNSIEKLSPFSVVINSSEGFSAVADPRLKGRILSEHGQMIQGLLDEPTLTLHVSCIPHDNSTTKKLGQISTLFPCDLEITVYGDSDLFEQIGIWFQAYGIYLQDPRACHHDVKYYNPHRCPRMTLDPALCSLESSRMPSNCHLFRASQRGRICLLF
jgi:hypothetical protein